MKAGGYRVRTHLVHMTKVIPWAILVLIVMVRDSTEEQMLAIFKVRIYFNNIWVSRAHITRIAHSYSVRIDSL